MSTTLHAPYQRDNRARWIITADMALLAVREQAMFCAGDRVSSFELANAAGVRTPSSVSFMKAHIDLGRTVDDECVRDASRVATA